MASQQRGKISLSTKKSKGHEPWISALTEAKIRHTPVETRRGCQRPRVIRIYVAGIFFPSLFSIASRAGSGSFS
jgi:hypothetical protein